MKVRELTPRALARVLSPEWRLDAPLLDGRWALTDVYAVGSERVVLELRAAAQALRVAVTPADPSSTSAGGLTMSWMPPGPADAGVAACRALVAILGAKVADRAKWVIPKDAELLVPDAVAEEVRVEPGRLEDDPDCAMLAKDARQYARLFGAAPRAARVVTGASPTPGVSLHYPPPRAGALPPSGRLYAVPQQFHRRRFRRYFAALGCTFEDGVPRTVPTPWTFEHAVIRVRGSPPPLRPRFVQGWRGSTSGAKWVERIVREQVLPVSVAPRWAVEVHRHIRRHERLATIPVDVGMLAHDVSLHALGLHAVSQECWAALMRRAQERVQRGPRARVKRVASFFEGSLTRTAWDVWSSVDDPESFAEAFDLRACALEAELARS